MLRNISARVDGGPSEGSSVRRPGREDPHWCERNFLKREHGKGRDQTGNRDNGRERRKTGVRGNKQVREETGIRDMEEEEMNLV